MTLITLKNSKDWSKHVKNTELKLNNAPFIKKEDEKPREYPCFVITTISKGINGYSIDNLFIYKEDFKNLN